MFSSWKELPGKALLCLFTSSPHCSPLLPTQHWGRSPGITSAAHLATWKAVSWSSPTTVTATVTPRGAMAPRPPRLWVRQQSPAPWQRRTPTHPPALLSTSQNKRKRVSTLWEGGKCSRFSFPLKEGKWGYTESVWLSRGLTPTLSRAHDGCCQYWVIILLLMVTDSRCPAKSGKNKQMWAHCFPTTVPGPGDPQLKDSLVSFCLIPLGGSFPYWFLLDKCKYPAPTKSSEDETYILITPCGKCASPFDAATPTHSCIRWALPRHRSHRQSGQSHTRHRWSRSRGMAAPTKAVLWASCRFSTAGAGRFCLWGTWILGDADVRNGKAELYVTPKICVIFPDIMEHRTIITSPGKIHLLCVKILLQMRQCDFPVENMFCKTNLC